MRKSLLLLFGLLLCSYLLQSQTVWEDFEDGGKLTWTANNGVYNGIIANPDTTGINKSDSVGSYTKSGAHSFSLFLSELDSAIDLSTDRVWKLQVWSPVQTEVLLKLEGTGPAIEGRRSILQDSTWVEYAFDFTGASMDLSATKIILFFAPGVEEDSSTYYFDNIIAEPLPDSMVWEDFEDGGWLPWEAVNGIYNGIVENPDTMGINKSPNVGSYTKEAGRTFSLFRASTPIDLSILNKVSIQVNSPVKSEFILKFEGAGPAIERRVNIPTANIWREYTMDFSTAEAKMFDRVLIFFDPGVEESDDTYLFDNLIVYPADECAGTVPVPGVLDDFECQRNATYDNGWDRITAVDNPDASEVNPSAKVGQYSKPLGQPWATLAADFDNPIDLSTLNVLKAKIWAPRPGQILFKLEGGASPAEEIFIDVPDTNTWVQYSADFSANAAEDHKKVSIFFGANDAVDEETFYYVDDIQFEEKTASVIEDFEMDTNFVWLPLNGDAANHGVWSIIDNPDPTGENTSSRVSSYTRGAAGVSTLSAIGVEPFDLSSFTQFNIQVWAPEGASTVSMQLVSASMGNADITRDIEMTGAWTTISFNFEEFSGVADVSQFNLIFDANSGITDPYYFDNISIGEATVDPCEGVMVDPLVVDDFECQRNVPISIGAADIVAVNNPDISSGNVSTTVGQYTEPDDGMWQSFFYDYGAGNGPDLSTFNYLSVKIWAPRVVPILFKLEGDNGNKEVFMDVTEAETWVTYSIDFSSELGMEHSRLGFFFNAGQAGMAGEQYYIDDIKWVRAPYNGCVADYETAESSVLGWTYFANGTYADSTIKVVPNPVMDAVNSSANVAEFVESGPGDNVNIFAGAFAPLDAVVVFPDPDNKIVKAKVWMEEAGRVVFKLEQSQTGAPNSGDIFAEYTTPGEWQEISWDFNAFPTGAQYKQIAFIPDFDVIPDATRKAYLDDIVIGAESSCDTTTGIFDFEPLESFTIRPNPVDDYIRIESSNLLSRIDVFDVAGRRVQIVRQTLDRNSEIEVGNLQAGMYFIAAYNLTGKVIANGKFIKL